jgi:hypothetical protein
LFKNVVSTILAEFHSTFATLDGLICPELKIMISSLQFRRGDKMSDDALVPVAGINTLRLGYLFDHCSL